MSPAASEPDDVLELVELAELQLEELRALRREAELQPDLLERVLERLESIERTQFS